jgi:hypothetical protein
MFVFDALAKSLRLVRSVYGRASPAGLFAGMFVAPGLGWPEGVQEEDLDRPWSWETPSPAREATREPPVAELIDVEDAGIPVHRVR